MFKKFCFWSTVIAILSIIYYIYSWLLPSDDIARAKKELVVYKAKYVSVNHRADSLELAAKTLETKAKGYLDEIDSLEKKVVLLEAQGRQEKDRIMELFLPDTLVEEMKKAFPEFKYAPMGLAKVPHPKTKMTITTFQIPIQLVTTFIADHKRIENYEQQMAALGGINGAYKNVVALKDSVINLKEQKALAYKEGLDYGMKKYEELNKEYIAYLKKPPKIGFPSVGTILTAGALGVAGGVAITK